jgi:asparagine synthetase A
MFISGPPLNEKGQPNRAQIDALKRDDISQSTGIFRLTTGMPPIDDQLLAYVSMVVSTNDHSKPIGARRQLWQYLHDRLQSLLNAYKLTESTIATDNDHRLASVEALKAGERCILESTLNYVDDQLRNVTNE